MNILCLADVLGILIRLNSLHILSCKGVARDIDLCAVACEPGSFFSRYDQELAGEH